MNSPLLKYAVQTNPDPIQASPSKGDSLLLTLVIAVSNNTGHPVECRSFSFSFLQGTSARDLFSDSTGIGTSAPTGWNLVQNSENSFEFDATPDTPQDGEIDADGVVFTISNIPVNNQPGTTEMTIVETTSGNVGTLNYPLAKFPLGFEVGDLTLPPYEVPPIDFGGSVTLRWNGTGGASCELRYNDAHDQTVTITKTKDGQPLPSAGSYTVDDLEKDTTFYLIVTLQVEGQDKPLAAERFITVAVNQPQPVINSFTYTATQTQLILRWETSHADTCTMTGDPHPVNASSTDNSYSRTWPDTNVEDGVYTLTASSSVLAGDNSVSRTIHTIPVINSFTASTTGPIDAGSPVTLQWDTSYAETVTIAPGVGTVQGKGSVVVNPANNTTYTLTCTGFGPDVTATPVTVEVHSVQITRFYLLTGPHDATGVLVWTTERATGLSIPELNFVADPSLRELGSKTVEIDPWSMFEGWGGGGWPAYTLTCEGPNGPVTRGRSIIPPYHNGMRFKDSSSGMMYLLMDWTLRYLNPAVYLAIPFNDSSNFITGLPDFPIGDPLPGGTMLIWFPDGNLYLVIAGVRRLVSQDVATLYDFNTGAALRFPEGMGVGFQDGPPLA
ncbi:MAG TPA: hypothetical protein VF543_04025 [Pyrinomonadaceae bacterium]|jgi:hypothetical protein